MSVGNKKCVLPWIHLNVETNGDVYPCCQSDLSLPPLGNLNRNTVSEIRNGNKFVELRQQMLNGQEPSYCKGCYEREEKFPSSMQSKRIRENKQWEKFQLLTNTPTVDDKLFYLDVRYSNVCNFKCRSCDPSGSHSIAAEQQKLGLNFDSSIIRRFDSKSLFEAIDDNISNLEEIYFVGGEPLLMEEHYTLLDKLIAAGNTSVRLRYNTNLSRFDFKSKNVLEYWKNFNSILVNASLDHYDYKLEYIRNGADWNVIKQNLKDLKNLPSVKLQIHWLMSVFNATDIFEIFDYYVSNNFINEEDFFLNVLLAPYYFCIQTLHPSLKIVVNDQIDLLLAKYKNINEFLRANLEQIKYHMNAVDAWPANKDKFIQITSLLDTARNENFKETFPQLKVQIDG